MYGGQGAVGGRALTSLNSWIWACSNMEKTLEDPRACLVAAALPRVPAFLLAYNTVGGEGSSPGLPEEDPLCTPEHSQESRVRSSSYPGDYHSASPPQRRPSSPQTWHSPSSLCGSVVAEGPTAPFMCHPYHLEYQIRKGGEDRPKLGSLCLGWGRIGPQVDSSHIPDDL